MSIIIKSYKMKALSIIFLAWIFLLAAAGQAQETDRLHRFYIPASPANNGFLKKNSWLLSPNGQYYLIMQSDGNLVIYRGTGLRDKGGAVWSIKTGKL